MLHLNDLNMWDKDSYFSSSFSKKIVLEIALSLGIKDFEASNFQLEHFKVRHCINFCKVCWEIRWSKWLWWLKEIPALYFWRLQWLKHIYYRWSRFFLELPSKAVEFMKNDCKDKLSKNYLAITLHGDALRKKEKPLIGKANIQWCFKIMYLQVSHGKVVKSFRWNNSIYEDWLIHFNKKCAYRIVKGFFFDNASWCSARRVVECENLLSTKYYFEITAVMSRDD